MANDLLKQFIRKNAMQLAMQVSTMVMLALAAYITIRLAPFAQDLAVIKTRVEAVEKTNSDDVSYADLDRLLQPMKESLSRIEGKLDAHLSR